MSQLSDAKRDDLRDTWQWNKEQLRWKFVKLWFDSLCCRKAVHEIHFGFVESHIQHVEIRFVESHNTVFITRF